MSSIYGGEYMAKRNPNYDPVAEAAKSEAAKAAEAERYANRKFDTVSADVIYGGGGGPTITGKRGIRVPVGMDVSDLQGLKSYGIQDKSGNRSFSNDKGTLTETQYRPEPGKVSTATNTWSGPNPFAYTTEINPRLGGPAKAPGAVMAEGGARFARPKTAEELGNPDIMRLIQAIVGRT